MTRHQQSKSPLWAEVKPHLSNYRPLANQDHHSKMPATIDFLGSRVSVSEGPAPLSVVCRLILSQGRYHPFLTLTSKVSPRSQIPTLTRITLTSRMRMLQTIMEHCLPSSVVADRLLRQ